MLIIRLWHPIHGQKEDQCFIEKKDVQKYSFKELYEQMCDIFYRFDEGDTTALIDIFHLKNFINYKMDKCT